MKVSFPDLSPKPIYQLHIALRERKGEVTPSLYHLFFTTTIEVKPPVHNSTLKILDDTFSDMPSGTLYLKVESLDKMRDD